MPNRNHYSLVAKQLRNRLNGKAFETVSRSTITDILREVSGEPTTRIKSIVARDLTQVMLEQQALRCYPSIEETDSMDNVRIFRAGSAIGNLVDLIIHPAKETDKEVGDMLVKLKGKWDWTKPAPGVDEH